MFFGDFRHLRKSFFVFGVIEPSGKIRHHAQGVIPESLNLDGFSDARRKNFVIIFRIHPGQLRAFFARVEQTVRVNVNVVACAAQMTKNYIGEFGV